MKLKSLLALIVVLIGLGVYVYYGIQKPLEEKDSPSYGRLAQGDLDSITTVEVKNKEHLIKLEKNENRWMITAPVNDLASESKIFDLFAALKRFKENRVLFTEEEMQKEKPDLAQFGLITPRISVSYKEPSLNAPFLIKVGSPNPGLSNVYAQAGASNALYLASMDLDFLASQRPEDFREMKLTTVRYENFSDLTLKSKGKETKFKNDGEKWVMTLPYTLPVDHEMVRQLAEKVSLIRANRFEEKAPAAASIDTRVIVGFKEGVSDARFRAGDQRPFGVEIQLARLPQKNKQSKGPETALFYAKGDKTPWAQVAQFHYDNLQKSPEDFIKKTFDDFEVADVKQVKVKIPSMPEINLERNDGDQWLAKTSKESKTANQNNLERGLATLRSMRALRFLEVSKAPSVYSLMIDLHMKDGSSKSYVFELKKDIGALYTKLGQTAVEYVTAPDIVKVNEWKWDFLTQNPATANSEVKKEKSE